MPLPIYTIQVNGQFFKGVSDNPIAITGTGGWYSEARDLYQLEFTDNQDEAKLAEGRLNLNSYINKLMEHQRLGTITIDEILIKKIGED